MRTTISAPPLPSRQTVILEGKDHRMRIADDAPLPTLRPNEILVRTVVVALNPCNFKMYERFPCPGALNGCDFSGVVVRLGSEVSDMAFAIGDRVCGAVHGSNPIRPDSGSFADYVAAEGEFTLKVPDAMSMEDAAALGGTGMATLGMALFRSLGLPGTIDEPVSKPEMVLVNGGSSSIGTMAMQLLRIVGHKPITTCSPYNDALAREFGAEEVFDYHSPDCAKQIKSYTRNSLRYVLDPFTDTRSISLCTAAMGRAGGKYCCLEMYPDYLVERKTLQVSFVMGPAILGHRLALDYGYEREADPEMRRFGVQWYRSMQVLMDQGRLKPHPSRILDGRFEAILEGIQMLKDKAVSGEKLVVVLSQE